MELFLIIIAFLIGFILVVLVIPPILRVAHAKNLFEPFEERKIHTRSIPPLGGVAIFLGFVFSSIIATDGYSFHSLKYILAAVILMFFIGLKDDLLVISASKKFIIQLIAALLLINFGNINLTNLHGILGVHEINHISSVLISMFVIIAIINSINLIDGIDGLASGLVIMASTVFGTWFFLAGQIQYSVVSFALAGSLAGFFLFNVFGIRNKLFMGDTGSLVIGLVVSILVIKFNEFNINQQVPFAIGAAPSMSFAIIIIPLVDTLRVVTIRLAEKRSPFSPDNHHIHHRLLRLVPNHFKVSLIIVGANALVIGVALLLNNISLNVNLQFIIIFAVGMMMCYTPTIILRIFERKVKMRKLAHQTG